MASGVRGRAKALLERILVASGVRSRGGRGLRGRVIVFAWHNVVPRGEQPVGDRSLHLPQAGFGDQLDLLLDALPVLSLADALAAPRDPDAEPQAVLTWDDAYAGAMTAGVEEVSRKGLPATVFVPPGCIGGGGFWWDALAGDEGLEAGLRTRCLEDLRGRDDLIRREAHDRGWKWRGLPEHARAADASTLDQALGLPGISAGSHSWSHPNLALATDGELEHELVQSRAWILRLGAKAVPALAYPYGASSRPVETAAASMGYVAGLRIDGGAWNPVTHRKTALPRFNVPAGLSISGLTLRIRGWFLQ